MTSFAKFTLGGALGLVLASGLAEAGECFQKHTEPVILGDGSKAFATQQARNTWQDWIWRGPIFRCPGGGTIDCTYRWGESKTTGYGWSVGVSLNPEKLPFIGKFLSILGVDGNYSQDHSMTTSYNWDIRISPGWNAQPIQVVERRWKSGQFRGAWVRTGNCSVGVGDPVGPHWYEWDGNRVSSSWSGNLEVSRFASYHVYQ
ncbi:hypothetical protein [uncultured Pseudomonas sp.]|uniref:hypothetical protein n=1 Tax=uncultured Pseudomonas sp. TaxID=114707 RepID=UPI0025DD478C|nr:hypothetical protein [uncultured Pseudomonas sp.]